MTGVPSSPDRNPTPPRTSRAVGAPDSRQFRLLSTGAVRRLLNTAFVRLLHARGDSRRRCALRGTERGRMAGHGAADRHGRSVGRSPVLPSHGALVTREERARRRRLSRDAAACLVCGPPCGHSRRRRGRLHLAGPEPRARRPAARARQPLDHLPDVSRRWRFDIRAFGMVMYVVLAATAAVGVRLAVAADSTCSRFNSKWCLQIASRG